MNSRAGNIRRGLRALALCLAVVAVVGLCSDRAAAFVPSPTNRAGSAATTKPNSTPLPTGRIGRSRPVVDTSLEAAAFVPTTAEAIQEMTNARFAFGMCFYGALGVGSIGRELIPIVFGRYQTTSSLESGPESKKTGKAVVSGERDDEDLGIWGYPETIYRGDVEKILNNKLTLRAIAEKYPIEQYVDGEQYKYTHMAETVPFLGYDGFCRANPGANPVALRAVFDSFSNSLGGSNAVSPITAQRNVDTFLEGSAGKKRGQKARVTGAMAKKLNGGKALGIAAFGFMLVLLGVGDALAIYHLWQGWFPEWQGFSDMPASLFDRDIGIAVLPSYFVGDVPAVPS